MSSPTTFKFDEKLTATLDELKAATGASTKAEIVRRAIALLKVVQDAKDSGGEVVIRTDDGAHGKKERLIVMP
ncbi:ribbon-helix-helix domain-containing protein [Stenotrophomonas maltophilia]|uniref:ribbon-helix-helix domain-containing protein n=1 Tax=Stenotrophomonas maltophilia TaxID=40324 RepID=UPI00240CF978|nr:ribbon-helix-helix domain-containing protein [Stenotrophomonas maltophilia]MDG2510974.1 ribbon-helix-helix domain-containing protein [Stenotrophomonas maltophilia]